jgi:hypothetical protein
MQFSPLGFIEGVPEGTRASGLLTVMTIHAGLITSPVAKGARNRQKTAKRNPGI